MHTPPWHASGLLFENCSCQLLCPAHISFKQTCDGDRCRGHWAFHIADGGFDDTPLADLNAVVVFEAPTRMYDGGWIQTFYIDARATAPQRDALEAIFSGTAGGPWEILGRFVSHQLDSRFVPMRFEDTGREKRLTVPDLFQTSVTAIRGSDGTNDAVVSNLHNVIHGAAHVLARGRTQCADRHFDFTNEGTHGLYSQFAWEVNS